MHPYGTDTNEHRNVLIFLVPISFWCSGAFLWLLSQLPVSLPSDADWIFDGGSAAAWFAILYLVMNNVGWKWDILHRIKLIAMPNLNGTWTGNLFSSYKPEGAEAFQTPYPVTLTIRQTWTQMVVELVHANSSRSRSDTASLLLDKGTAPILVYTYWNDPYSHQKDLEAHSGTTELTLVVEGNSISLDGRYYNGRGRGNYGTMRMTKIS